MCYRYIYSLTVVRGRYFLDV